jgi:hypothetical protein
MMNGSIHQKNMIILEAFEPNNSLKYMKQKL